MNSQSRTGFRILVALTTALAATVARPVSIERPKVQIVDRFSVNVATGQVTQGLETVSIGGPMGLTHGISVHANEFDFLHNWGYDEKFWSETRYVRLSNVVGAPIPNVLRISDKSESADFIVYKNG